MRMGIDVPRRKETKLDAAAPMGDSCRIPLSTALLTLENSPRLIETAPAKAAAIPGVTAGTPLERREMRRTEIETTPSWNPMVVGRIRIDI
jgi:hypothetical protein